MSENNRSIQEVAEQCIACDFKGSNECDYCDNKPVTMCIPYNDFVITNGELALLANATEQVLSRLQADIKFSITRKLH